jgi:hypothetical protein
LSTINFHQYVFPSVPNVDRFLFIRTGKNLFQVATHEFGHSLGLEHTNLNNTAAVMYFAYEYRSDFKLHKDDIEGIQVQHYCTKIKIDSIHFFPLMIPNDSLKKTNFRNCTGRISSAGNWHLI